MGIAGGTVDGRINKERPCGACAAGRSVPPAVSMNGGRVEVRAAIDEEQILGMLTLWEQWSAEKGHTFDRHAWGNYMEGRVLSGRYVPLVAFCGVRPVGMVECVAEVDPMDGKRVGFGDHLYVAADMRGCGVAKKLIDAAVAMKVFLGTDRECLPVDAKAPWLVNTYLRHGFELSGYLMRRG